LIVGESVQTQQHDEQCSAPTPARRRRGQNLDGQDRPNVKTAFLDAFRRVRTVSAAACVVGVHRSTLYDWRATDQDFATAWRDAEETILDELEANVFAAANHGAMGLEPSNAQARLAEFLLKGRRPEVYGDRSRVDVRSVSVAIEVPTDPERARAVAEILLESGAINTRDLAEARALFPSPE
jgi:hypothetical protein